MKDPIYKPNDAWIICRQDIETVQEGVCNAYFLLDAYSRFIFGTETSIEKPTQKQIISLFNKAKVTSGTWPKQVLLSKKDPFIDLFKTVCEELNLNFSSDVTDRELKPYVQGLLDSFGKFTRGK